MSKLYRVSFYYSDSSGKQLNQSLFCTKDLALSFALQIGMASNISDVNCDLVNIETISVINLCESLHGKNSEFEVINANK